MQITLEIPDRIEQRLGGESKPIERRVLEILVADAYSSGALSTAEVGRTLGISSRLETHAFLKSMGVYLNYDEAELERDLQSIAELKQRRQPSPLIAGKAKITGDLVSPIVDENDWECLK